MSSLYLLFMFHNKIYHPCAFIGATIVCFQETVCDVQGINILFY